MLQELQTEGKKMPAVECRLAVGVPKVGTVVSLRSISFRRRYSPLATGTRDEDEPFVEAAVTGEWQTSASSTFAQFFHRGPEWCMWTDGPDGEMTAMVRNAVVHEEKEEEVLPQPFTITGIDLVLEDGAVASPYSIDTAEGVFFWSYSASHSFDQLVHRGDRGDQLLQLPRRHGSVLLRTRVIGVDDWPLCFEFVEKMCREISSQSSCSGNGGAAVQPSASSLLLLVVPTWTPALVLGNAVHFVLPGAIVAHIQLFTASCPCTTARSRVSLVAAIAESLDQSESPCLQALCRVTAVDAVLGHSRGAGGELGCIRREFLRQEQLSLLPAAGGAETKSTSVANLALVVNDFATRLDTLDLLSIPSGSEALCSPRRLGTLVDVRWTFASSSTPLDAKVLVLTVDISASATAIARHVGIGCLNHEAVVVDESTKAQPFFRVFCVPVSLLVVAEQEMSDQSKGGTPVLDEQELMVTLKVPCIGADESSIQGNEYTCALTRTVLVDLSGFPLSSLQGVQKLVSRVSCQLIVDPDMCVPVLHHRVETITSSSSSFLSSTRLGNEIALIRANALWSCLSQGIHQLVTPRLAVLEGLVWNAPPIESSVLPQGATFWTGSLMQKICGGSKRNHASPMGMGTCGYLLATAGCDSPNDDPALLLLRSLVLSAGDKNDDSALPTLLVGMTSRVAVSAFLAHVFFLHFARKALLTLLSQEEQEVVHWMVFDLADDPYLPPCFRKELLRLRQVEEHWDTRLTL